MNNPCENKGYRAILKVFLEIEDLQFSTKCEIEFDTNLYENPTEDELMLRVVEVFNDKYSEYLDFESSIEVISIKKE